VKANRILSPITRLKIVIVEEEGELADAVNFFWWADDGDNVFEDDEVLLPAGPLGLLDVGQTATIALADSNGNIWDGEGPLVGDETHFIGKAWCFGDSAFEPYEQDGGNQQSGPDDRPVQCNGAPVNNITQTDSMTADIAFRAVQSRNNGGFVCDEPPATTGSLRFEKIVINDDGGSAVPGDFDFEADGPSGVFSNNIDGDILTDLDPGDYLIAETGGPPGYTSDFSSCGSGSVAVVAGEETVCTVTNDDIAQVGGLIVTKDIVNNDGGDATEGDFSLFVDGAPKTFGVEVILSPGDYVVSETGVSGYAASFGVDCDGAGNVTITANATSTCTITNNDIAPNITLTKSVINNQGGSLGPANFNMTVNGVSVPSGTSILVDANFPNVIDEDAESGYSFVDITGDPECPVVLGGTATLDEGEAISCTITNVDDLVIQ